MPERLEADPLGEVAVPGVGEHVDGGLPAVHHLVLDERALAGVGEERPASEVVAAHALETPIRHGGRVVGPEVESAIAGDEERVADGQSLGVVSIHGAPHYDRYQRQAVALGRLLQLARTRRGQLRGEDHTIEAGRLCPGEARDHPLHLGRFGQIGPEE